MFTCSSTKVESMRQGQQESSLKDVLPFLDLQKAVYDTRDVKKHITEDEDYKSCLEDVKERIVIIFIDSLVTISTVVLLVIMKEHCEAQPIKCLGIKSF